jgi:DNA-binding protein Fis
MSSLTKRLASVRDRATDATLLPFAEEIAAACMTRRLPKTCAAAHMRHARKSLKTAGSKRLSELVTQEMTRANANRPLLVVVSPYCQPREGAALLGINERTLLERLKQNRWRQFYGWAHFDGHHWMIPRAAIAPETRAAFLISQPAEEPDAHVAMLPLGCDGKTLHGMPCDPVPACPAEPAT